MLVSILTTLWLNTFAPAAVVGRYTVGRTGDLMPLPGHGKDRVELIRRGLKSELSSPAERAQYHLLLCQPQAAWMATEQIEDPSLRDQFKAAILALSATPRPSVNTEAQLEMNWDVEPAVRFALDEDEIWADEIDDIQIEPSCEFPIATEPEKLLQEARALFTQILTSDDGAHDVALYSLATDVGLQPTIPGQLLRQLESGEIESVYTDRFKFLNEQMRAESQSDILNIKDRRATLSPLTLIDTQFTPHPIEIPWLLRQ